MRTRTWLALGMSAGLLIAPIGVAPSPAAAGPVAVAQQVPATADPVIGDFFGDAREELFAYQPGPGADAVVSFARTSGTVTTTRHAFAVNRTYQPIAGNFDGDGDDEIVWYARGTGADHLWNFTGPDRAVSTPMTIDGAATPGVGDFTGDGVEDLYWHGGGTGTDVLWDFAADGTYVAVDQPIDDWYDTPVVGSFGADATDDIYWDAAFSATPDVLWDFLQGTTEHREDENYQVWRYKTPFALDVWGDGWGGSDIFWYWPGPGTGPDQDELWDFAGGRRVTVRPEPVNGDYFPIDTGDLFGDGSDDVLWFEGAGVGTVNLWDHDVVGGTTLVRHRSTLTWTTWFTAVGRSTQTVPVTSTSTVATR